MSYYFLISSLPYLSVDQDAPFTAEHFLGLCEQDLTPEQAEVLKKVTLQPESVRGLCEVADRWAAFETHLRNWVTRRRTHKTDFDPEKYLREDLDLFSGMEKWVEEAFDTDNPVETEKALDRIRWAELDNLSSGHDFDFEVLFIYLIKILLLEKWSGLEKEQGQEQLQSAVDNVIGSYSGK